jgi:hypothetical protein
MLRWLLDGIMFDVEQNGFWLPEWGPQPSLIEHAKSVDFLAPSLVERTLPDQMRSASTTLLMIHSAHALVLIQRSAQGK